MNNSITTILFIIFAYLLGSVTMAIVLAKLMHLPDPRAHGSGNPGATNMLRSGNKTAALFTLLGDMIKGLVPVILARFYDVSVLGQALVAFAAFLGHLYPVFFNFQGGKGVATALGVLLGLAPLLGLAVAITWVIVFTFSRISSLAALAATTLAPVYAWWLVPIQTTLIVGVMAIVIMWRHHSNIRNLLARREKQL